ncbi:MAG TPA: aldehyde dehydrogenase family protein [Actinomycetota bacterium]|nr:aldehyde dehydrogenase family protein [Actinomycetota bacterium]
MTIEVPGPDHAHVHASGATFLRQDPATGEPVAEVRASTPEDVDAAVRRAQGAFEEGSWAADGAARARALTRFAEALRAEKEPLARLLVREQGKTIREARGEIEGSADMTEYYAGLARAVYGRSVQLARDVHGVIVREPVGVVAVITPWNWPVTLLVRSLAPALAAGNACVVKPASLTSAITVRVLDLLARAGELPDGVVTCVLGPGATVGEALVAHPGVDMVAFTGETTTGTRVMQRAAEGLRRVALELGGKSPNLIFADADLDKAVEGAVNAAFTTSGQICTAGSRILVERPVHDEFLDRFAEAVRALRLGPGMDERSDLGPLVSEGQRQRVLDYVELGRKEGTVLVGGTIPTDPALAQGHFVEPTVVIELPPGSPLLREEIFGPVATVEVFDHEEEAIRLANDTDYGLASGLWTSDLNRAWRVGRALRAGTVWVNTYHHFYPEAEVGGFKRSGIGRQQGVEGLFEFTETKHLNFDGSPTLW